MSDLDGTMVGEGPAADAATQRFCDYWEDTASLAGSVLVYNTGRSLGQFTGLWAEKRGALALPDVLITAVGTKVGTPEVLGLRLDVRARIVLWQPSAEKVGCWSCCHGNACKALRGKPSAHASV